MLRPSGLPRVQGACQSSETATAAVNPGIPRSSRIKTGTSGQDLAITVDLLSPSLSRSCRSHDSQCPVFVTFGPRF